MQLFSELLREVADAKNHTLPDCLFKAKLLAARLKGRKFRQWVDAELNGYPIESLDILPEYRRVLVPVVGHFAGPWGSAMKNVRLETDHLPEKLRDYIEYMPMVHNVGALEARANAGQEVYHRQLEAFVVDALRKLGTVGVSGMVLSHAENWITDADYRGVLHAIRTKLLEFLIELAAEYPELEQTSTEAVTIPSDAADRLTDRVIYQNCTFSGGSPVANQRVNVSGGMSAGRDIVIAGRIRDSFNRVTNSAATQPMKDLLGQLAKAIGEVVKEMDEKQQGQTADDYDMLAKEAVREETRPSLLKAAGEALMTSVAVAGKLAEPVANIITAILKAHDVSAGRPG